MAATKARETLDNAPDDTLPSDLCTDIDNMTQGLASVFNVDMCDLCFTVHSCRADRIRCRQMIGGALA